MEGRSNGLKRLNLGRSIDHSYQGFQHFGVPMHICQALLQYPEESCFDRDGQALMLSYEIKGDANPAPFGETLVVPICGGAKAYLSLRG